MIDYKEVKAGISHSREKRLDWWDCKEYENYQKALKGLTGLIFIVLGISILNYGTKLETAISSSISPKTAVFSQINGLDLRILTITILLSLVFLCRSLIDLLFAWNILKINLQSPYIDLILIIFTELGPSMLITLIMKKKSED